MITAIRISLAVGGTALLALIIWASLSADIGQSFGAMIDDPWGVVALFDLYLGFVFLAPIIWFFERRKLIALAFLLSLPFLGNVWAAVWIVWRLGGLVERLKPGPATT